MKRSPEIAGRLCPVCDSGDSGSPLGRISVGSDIRGPEDPRSVVPDSVKVRSTPRKPKPCPSNGNRDGTDR